MSDTPRLRPPQFDSAGTLIMSEDQQRAATGLIHSIARKHIWPGIEYDDLIQEGWKGLIQAAEKYQPESGTQFATYAVPRIRGMMQDYCRINGAGPVKKHRHGPMPGYDYLDAPHPISQDVSGSEMIATMHEILPGDILRPDEEAEQNEETQIIWSTINGLPERFNRFGKDAAVNPRELLIFGWEHNFENGWQRDAAVFYHITESRISQILRMSMATFREIFTSQYSASDFSL